MTKLLNDTDFTGLPLYIKGKVRNVYDLNDKLLIIVTDRISAFDIVLPNLIHNKGKVLNRISEHWFNSTKDIVKNHMITTNIKEYPLGLCAFGDELQGRSMLVKKTPILEVECVVRGYLAGSGWKEYQKNGSICGVKIPSGMRESEKLPEPIFTPTTKAKVGHDENITFEEVSARFGTGLAKKLRDISIELYCKISSDAQVKGLILADTKFEFGIDGDHLMLADEVGTPDSSRYWSIDKYEVGKPQQSFDKQYVRDYLELIKWDKNPPAPFLPEDIVRNTELKYIEAYERITGRSFE